MSEQGFNWREQNALEFRPQKPRSDGKPIWQVVGVFCENREDVGDSRRQQLLGWVDWQEKAGEFLFYTDKPIGVSAMLLGYIGSFIFDQNEAAHAASTIQ